MKEVPLVNKHREVVGVTLVDDADFEAVSQHSWYLLKERHTSYAATKVKGRHVRLHRFLLPGVAQIDHADRNGLNNCRDNLRPAAPTENQANTRPRKGKKYKGVSWNTRKQKWQAQIRSFGMDFHLGYFDDETAAARAYDEMAFAVFGEFAYLNFPDQIEQYREKAEYEEAMSAYWPDGTPVIPKV